MGDRRKCQTFAASPAEPGGLPVMLAGIAPRSSDVRSSPSTPDIAASAWDVRKVLKAEVAASFDHRTAHRESRKAPQWRHDLVVHVD